jgi:uncharacterized cupredoxin-like copper-binding protein
MIRNIIIILFYLGSTVFPQVMGPKATPQQSDYDFGEATQNDIVNHSFVLTNNGGDVLKILDVKASCGCTAANPDKNELKPGESTQIKVSFNTKGRKGPQTKTITVKTNDPDNPIVTYKLSGNVIVKDTKDNTSGAIIFFPEMQHDFGKVKEGDVVNYEFTFQNKGAIPLTIKDIKTSCGCTAAVVSEKNIDPGKSGTIKVGLDTKNRQGKMSRTITVISNDFSEPNKIITIFADVQKN